MDNNLSRLLLSGKWSTRQNPEECDQRKGSHKCYAPPGPGPRLTMIVRGSLFDDGKEIANFEGDKGTMGATGTCTTLGNAEKDLGKDIGRWLDHPKPNDRLGQ